MNSPDSPINSILEITTGEGPAYQLSEIKQTLDSLPVSGEFSDWHINGLIRFKNDSCLDERSLLSISKIPSKLGLVAVKLVSARHRNMPIFQDRARYMDETTYRALQAQFHRERNVTTPSSVVVSGTKQVVLSDRSWGYSTKEPLMPQKLDANEVLSLVDETVNAVHNFFDQLDAGSDGRPVYLPGRNAFILKPPSKNKSRK